MDDAPQCGSSVVEHTAFRLMLTVLGVAQLPVGAVATYCILCKSTKVLRTYRWLLLVFQCWTVLFVAALTFGVAPILFFPFLAGYSNGLLTVAGVAVRIQLLGAAILLEGLAASMLCLFEYRHNSVLPQYHRLKRSFKERVVKYIAIHLLCFAFIFPPLLLSPEQNWSKRRILEQWPNPPCDFWRPNTLILSAESFGWVHVYVLLGVGTFLAVATFYVTHASYVIHSNWFVYSCETRRMQKVFLKSLVVLTSVSCGVLALPIVFLNTMTYWVASYNYDQRTNNLVLCMVASHGVVASTMLIIVHRPYRKFAYFYFRTTFCAKRSKTSPLYTVESSRVSRTSKASGAKMSVAS